MGLGCAKNTVVSVLVMLIVSVACGQVRFNSPQPGDIYREYTRSMNGQDYLQVPDPNIDLNQFPTVAPYIPAPPISIWIGDLSGAIRAEALIVYIGGHISTIGQKMRWNGNAWMDIPLLDSSNGIPAGHQGYDYLMLHNITMDIPLSQLFEGTNYFQGTSGTQGDPRYSFGWGQWGWYAMIVRIYYGPGKPHATGLVTSPVPGSLLNQNPGITAEVTSGSAQQIDFLAYYEDYDTDGDGVYLSYHHDYMMTDGQGTPRIKNHVGTATTAPWSVTWNTDWVPDQPAGQVKLVARIRDANDIWYVTPEVTQLSLLRSGNSVRLYKPVDMPERCWVKGDVNQGYGYGHQVIHFDLPSSDKLGGATAAQYYIRLWNGANVNSQDSGQSEYRHFNNWSDVRFGADHHYTFDTRVLPVSALQSGTNTWDWYNTVSLHHGIEVLWPGPALAVRYTGGYASPVPAMTGLASPANGSVGEAMNDTLRWHPGLAAASYDVQLSTDSLFGSIVTQVTGLTDTNAQVGPLSGQTRYFWRVRSVNPAGASPYTDPWNFTTAIAPTAVPSLLAPSNSDENRPVNLTIRWHAAPNAQTYHLQLGTDSTFGSGVAVEEPAMTDTQKTVNGLLHDTKYYWRVRSANAGGPSAFSATWNFRTIVQLPGPVSLLYPANGQEFHGTRPVLTWIQSHPGVERYRLDVSVDSLFAFRTTDTSLTDTLKTTVGWNADGQVYWWRVAAKNVAGWGPLSEARWFRMPLIYGVELPDQGIPNATSLSQNYPNPFNPTTVIRFGLPERAHVRLAVYNALGEIVRELVNREMEAGFHEVSFDAGSLPSGAYFCRMVAGTFSQSRRILLLR